jgi:hypothetical protein
MAFMYRSADYRHQVLEISAPVPAAADTATVFARCAAEVSNAIRRSPASWVYMASGGDLAGLGLIPPAGDRSPAAEPVIPTNRIFVPDGSTHDLATRG